MRSTPNGFRADNDLLFWGGEQLAAVVFCQPAEFLLGVEPATKIRLCDESGRLAKDLLSCAPIHLPVIRNNQRLGLSGDEALDLDVAPALR